MAPRGSFDGADLLESKLYVQSPKARVRNIFLRLDGSKSPLSPSSSSAGSQTDFFSEDSCDDTLAPQERRVRFAVTVKKCTIINLDDYTDEEWSKCWYTEKDEQKTFKKLQKMIDRIEAGKPERSRMTYRGLEVKIGQGKEEFDIEVTRCINAVMDEQDRQWYETRVDDHDRIAAVSLAVTKTSKERAYRLGLADEAAARYDEDSVCGEFTAFTEDDGTAITGCISPPRRKLSKKISKARMVKRSLDPPGKRISEAISTGTIPLTRIRNDGRRRGFQAV